jgi:hypothetical protein
MEETKMTNLVSRMMNNLKRFDKVRQRTVINDFLENGFLTKIEHKQLIEEMGLKNIRTKYKNGVLKINSKTN